MHSIWKDTDLESHDLHQDLSTVSIGINTDICIYKETKNPQKMMLNIVARWVKPSRDAFCKLWQNSGSFIETDKDFPWKPKVVMIPTLSSQVAPEVVVTTTSAAASDDKVGIMTTRCFHCPDLSSFMIGYISFQRRMRSPFVVPM